MDAGYGLVVNHLYYVEVCFLHSQYVQDVYNEGLLDSVKVVSFIQREDHVNFVFQFVYTVEMSSMRREAEGVHWMEKSRVFLQGLLRPLEMWAGSEERPQKIVCYKAGHETGILDLDERRVR